MFDMLIMSKVLSILLIIHMCIEVYHYFHSIIDARRIARMDKICAKLEKYHEGCEIPRVIKELNEIKKLIKSNEN